MRAGSSPSTFGRAKRHKCEFAELPEGDQIALLKAAQQLWNGGAAGCPI